MPTRASNLKVTLLMPCVGRRVELVQAFRRAARALGVELRLIGADSTMTAPALYGCDEQRLLPTIASDDYIPALLQLVDDEAVDLLLPTIDTDLPAIAANREAFTERGCTAIIASPEVIEVCRDKRKTFEFLTAGGFDTPRTWTAEQVRAFPEPRYPYLVKPQFGSASVSVHKIEDALDLDYHLAKVRYPIVQEFVEGVEHTLDVYVGLTGAPRCVVPRRRIQVRGGEVSKGVVVKDREVMEAGCAVVRALGDSVRGLVTLQCIVTRERRIRFIEINPRFGGGAPLGIAAGADYPKWLLEEFLGRTPAIVFDGFTDGLMMSRFDWSVFLPTNGALEPELNTAKPRPFPPF